MSLPTALTYLYTSADEIRSRLSSMGVDARLDDTVEGEPTDEELENLDDIVNEATSRVNLFLGKRYVFADLATSWQVHRWATTIGTVFLCERRGNPVPKSLLRAERRAEADMQAIRDGDLDLSDIGERESTQPSMSNMTMDRRYTARPLRKQKALSTPRPSAIPSNIHYPTEAIAAAEEYSG